MGDLELLFQPWLNYALLLHNGVGIDIGEWRLKTQQPLHEDGLGNMGLTGYLRFHLLEKPQCKSAGCSACVYHDKTQTCSFWKKQCVEIIWQTSLTKGRLTEPHDNGINIQDPSVEQGNLINP